MPDIDTIQWLRDFCNRWSPPFEHPRDDRDTEGWVERTANILRHVGVQAVHATATGYYQRDKAVICLERKVVYAGSYVLDGTARLIHHTFPALAVLNPTQYLYAIDRTTTANYITLTQGGATIWDHYQRHTVYGDYPYVQPNDPPVTYPDA